MGVTDIDPAVVLADVRAQLKAAAEDDASRRVRCDVCQAMTRDPQRHDALHIRAVDNATTGSRRDEHPCWSTVRGEYRHLWFGGPWDVKCVDCGAEWEGP